MRALKPCHGTSIIARLSFHFPRVLFFSGTSAEGYRGKKLCHRETRGGWYTVLGRSEVPQATRSPRVQKSDVLIYQLVSMSRRIPSHQLRTDIDLLLLRLIIGSSMFQPRLVILPSPDAIDLSRHFSRNVHSRFNIS